MDAPCEVPNSVRSLRNADLQTESSFSPPRALRLGDARSLDSAVLRGGSSPRRPLCVEGQPAPRSLAVFRAADEPEHGGIELVDRGVEPVSLVDGDGEG